MDSCRAHVSSINCFVYVIVLIKKDDWYMSSVISIIIFIKLVLVPNIIPFHVCSSRTRHELVQFWECSKVRINDSHHNAVSLRSTLLYWTTRTIAVKPFQGKSNQRSFQEAVTYYIGLPFSHYPFPECVQEYFQPRWLSSSLSSHSFSFLLASAQACFASII